MNDHRCYTDEDGIEWPRWGAIGGLLDKSEGLLPWAANCAIAAYKTAIDGGANADTAEGYAKEHWRDKSEEAKSIGSEVHEMISRYIAERIKGFDQVHFNGQYRDEVTAAFVAFLDWEKAHVKRWIATEQAVIYKYIGYGCTVDAVAEMIDGRIMAIDFKCSKALHDDNKIQVVANMLAWNYVCIFTGSLLTTSCGLLRLDKETGLPEWKEVEDLKRWAEVVETLTTLFYQLKKRRLKDNPFVERYCPTTTKKGKSKVDK